jgi:hypothetical protein
MSKRLARTILAYGFLICVIIIVISANPSRSKLQSKGYQTKSRNWMSQIALAVEAFELDHNGKGPGELADLVPKYISDAGGFLFESPYTSTVKPMQSVNPSREMIEVFSAYVYVPLAKGAFVIAERPGMWKDGTVGYVFFGEKRDTSNYHRVSVDEFQRLVAEGFPDASANAASPAGK